MAERRQRNPGSFRGSRNWLGSLTLSLPAQVTAEFLKAMGRHSSPDVTYSNDCPDTVPFFNHQLVKGHKNANLSKQRGKRNFNPQ